MFRTFLIWIQIATLLAGIASAQTARADKVKQDVGKIGILGTLSVYMLDGTEYYGSIRAIGNDDFTVDEVDRKRDFTIRYVDVKKIAEGYGAGHTINGRRLNPRRKLITTLIVVGALLTLVVVAVAADKS